MFGIAAVVLLALASLMAFGAVSGISAAGLAYAGLACLAVHSLGVAATPPWRRG